MDLVLVSGERQQLPLERHGSTMTNNILDGLSKTIQRGINIFTHGFYNVLDEEKTSVPQPFAMVVRYDAHHSHPMEASEGMCRSSQQHPRKATLPQPRDIFVVPAQNAVLYQSESLRSSQLMN
jgi:hypothetical protein